MIKVIITFVAKGLKLKVRRLWRLIPTFVEVTEEKLVRVTGGGVGWGAVFKYIKIIKLQPNIYLLRFNN